MLTLLKEEYREIIEEILEDKKRRPQSKFEYKYVYGLGGYLMVIMDGINYSSYDLSEDDSDAVIEFLKLLDLKEGE